MATVSTALVKLVQRCVADVARNPVNHVDIFMLEELTTWHVALRFPEEAPFLGGPDGSLKAFGFSLYLTLQFSEDFPARPPKLKFQSKWINHQHLWGDRICHSLLSDDFLDFFRERQTHGTSMWNASCALSDDDGMGGMPRYLQVLREFLASDPDYAEEQHVKYDAGSLWQDVEVQKQIRPDWLDDANRLEPAVSKRGSRKTVEAAHVSASTGYVAHHDVEEAWGTDFFSKTPLLPGNLESHPCFDVAVMPGRVPSLSTAMASLSKNSFVDGARTTDFGSSVNAILPYPCSRAAWHTAAKGLAQEGLQQLSPVAEGFYKLQLPSCVAGENEAAVQHEAILGVLGELWKTTCIGIVRDQGYHSERAMMCFVTLHFLLLCLAEAHPGLKSHAVDTAKEFLELVATDTDANLKSAVPDLGRFLFRFLLTEGELPLRQNLAVVVRELFNRNVRWVPSDFWPDAASPGAEKEEQVAASFEASQFGMKLTVFQSYYILRSTELGLNTISALEQCGGRPAADALKTFQEDCRGIKEMGSYAEFFLWLKLESHLEKDIHQMLCDAVLESDARGYNGGLPQRG